MSLMKIALYPIINHTNSPIVVIQPFLSLSLSLSLSLFSLSRTTLFIPFYHRCFALFFVRRDVSSSRAALYTKIRGYEYEVGSNNSREDEAHRSYAFSPLNFPNFFPFFFHRQNPRAIVISANLSASISVSWKSMGHRVCATQIIGNPSHGSPMIIRLFQNW